MPTVVELRVIVGARGDDGLKHGDTVTIKGTSGVVQGMRELNKNMEVTLQTGEDCSMTRRVPLNSEINVLRAILTDEERTSKKMERLLQLIEQNCGITKKQMESALQRGNNIYKDREGKGFTYNLIDLDDFAAAKASELEWHWWEITRRTMLELMDLKHSAEESAYLAAKDAVEQVTARLLSRYNNPLSRSTSTISNLVEDLERSGMAKFLDDIKWYVNDIDNDKK